MEIVSAYGQRTNNQNDHSKPLVFVSLIYDQAVLCGNDAFLSCVERMLLPHYQQNMPMASGASHLKITTTSSYLWKEMVKTEKVSVKLCASKLVNKKRKDTNGKQHMECFIQCYNPLHLPPSSCDIHLRNGFFT